MSSWTYPKDLLKNLSMDRVHNPDYICQQKFSQCGHLDDPSEKQKCKVFWSEVCQQPESSSTNPSSTHLNVSPTIKS
jgi:hypothetical protein